MSQLFERKPIAALIEDTEGEKGLKRTLGAGDLIMLAIGAVIGAGIFGAIGTAAAGQIGPNGEVIRVGAGPALVFSFLLLGAACALAGLCYAELAAMIPQAGSAYAYSYATLGELVAWIIGWDLILEYAVGNVAVAISWGDYFNTLLRGFNVALPVWLTTGYRTALLSSDPAIHGLLTSAPHVAGIPILINLPAFSIVMLITWLLLRGARESATANNIMVVIKLMALALFVAVGATHLHARKPAPVRAERLQRHPPGRGDRVLRLHRLRRDLDRRRGNGQPAAQPADRHPWRPGHLHRHLRHRRLRADRHGAVQGAGSGRSAGPRARTRAASAPSGWIVALGATVSMSAVLLVFQYGQPRIFFAMARDGLLPQWAARIHPVTRIPWATTLFTGVFVAAWSLIGDAGETYDLTNIGTLVRVHAGEHRRAGAALQGA